MNSKTLNRLEDMIINLFRTVIGPEKGIKTRNKSLKQFFRD
jgi:hypothetical protein